MFYAGIDYAKRFSVVTVLDVQGRVLKKGRLMNRRKEFVEFFQRYQPLSAVTEAGRNWHVVVDLLEGIADEIKLAHPHKVKAIAEARIKTDSIDSDSRSIFESFTAYFPHELLPAAHPLNDEPYF